jgi:hypothetical protein
MPYTRTLYSADIHLQKTNTGKAFRSIGRFRTWAGQCLARRFELPGQPIFCLML